MQSERAWCAEARALAQRAAVAEAETRGFCGGGGAARRSEFLAAERKALGDEVLRRARSRAAAQVGLRVELRGKKGALERLREELAAIQRGDARLAARYGAARRRREAARRGGGLGGDEDGEAVGEDGGGADELGLRRFDGELTAFRTRMREEFEDLRTRERTVARDLDLAAARFEAWEREAPYERAVAAAKAGGAAARRAPAISTAGPPSYAAATASDPVPTAGAVRNAGLPGGTPLLKKT